MEATKKLGCLSSNLTNAGTELSYKKVEKLLSEGYSNAKTKKNIRETLILYLSPAKQNSKGINLCPKASNGCLMACLFTAGHGKFTNTQNARINRTEYYLADRFLFLEQIAKEINKKAKKTNGDLAIRLNGTSDVKLVEMVTSMYGIEENVVFYDYTKIPTKAGDKIMTSGHRYKVTFSRAEDNDAIAMEILENGGNVSMVFAKELPKEYKGFKVIDGDERDDLMLDIEGGCIIGLKAKGKARKDTSGFVITDY
jgi:hypothetical protein